MLRCTCLLLLPLFGALVLVFALDELEYDAQVAPPIVEQKPSMNLWRSFVVQVRQVFRRWRPQPRIITKRPSIQLKSTTPGSQPELQYYGALNPIYQM